MPTPNLESISPFFLVSNVPQTIAFYENKLGFTCDFREPPEAPFFAILRRDNAMLFIKSGAAQPQPNPTRDPDIRWDAYVLTHNPDALAADLLARAAPFTKPLQDTHENLRGFEITDPDGYVLFFGHPK